MKPVTNTVQANTSECLPAGVYKAYKKDGTLYYRASITFQNKHISLGSYSTSSDAHEGYKLAGRITSEHSITLKDYNADSILTFEKWVVLINFRDNRIYFKTPIYMLPKYFLYYLDEQTELKFDVDDLFYYSNHKIMRRKGHLFVADYGMQVSIISRYGIPPYSVAGKDYIFVNGDEYDFRYTNIKIINHYIGVKHQQKNGRDMYTAKIHINGDYIIGHYTSSTDAAVAYNKTVDLLQEKGLNKQFLKNYLEDMSSIQYASTYNRVKISKKIRDLEF